MHAPHAQDNQVAAYARTLEDHDYKEDKLHGSQLHGCLRNDGLGWSPCAHFSSGQVACFTFNSIMTKR